MALSFNRLHNVIERHFGATVTYKPASGDPVEVTATVGECPREYAAEDGGIAMRGVVTFSVRKTSLPGHPKHREQIIHDGEMYTVIDSVLASDGVLLDIDAARRG